MAKQANAGEWLDIAKYTRLQKNFEQISEWLRPQKKIFFLIEEVSEK